jgi:hypothetical protein
MDAERSNMSASSGMALTGMEAQHLGFQREVIHTGFRFVALFPARRFVLHLESFPKRQPNCTRRNILITERRVIADASSYSGSTVGEVIHKEVGGPRRIVHARVNIHVCITRINLTRREHPTPTGERTKSITKIAYCSTHKCTDLSA